jgi:hypothetical protein
MRSAIDSAFYKAGKSAVASLPLGVHGAPKLG